jgi:hypothetical protein
MIKLSYAIPVKDELIELQTLLKILIETKDEGDEIVIQFDSKNGSKMVEDFLRSHSINKDCGFKWHPYPFEGDFSEMKNNLIKMCNGDYIIQLDADEQIETDFTNFAKIILESNSDIEAFALSRINTVKGITEEHIKKWGWNVNEHGYINWPDPQLRIFKNNGKIKWKNKVHEVLIGYDSYGFFPEELSILHHKDIIRQENQNKLYETIS